jgi:hypothetical protein
VAVVQLSKIQIRRGQKNTGSGLPQLASGELGWAIDSQELYIGNGAVSEGAPAVGNTKILTEKDDLFSIADTYSYRAPDGFVNTGIDSASPIVRSLQDRLDDRVSVRSFGAIGDGVADDTANIQRAIDQLYLNAATKTNPQSRVTLHIEAGIYRITDALYLPPYATLEGAGSDKTVISQTAALPVFVTVNSSSTPGSPSDDSSSTLLNQAREILVSGVTLQRDSAGIALQLESCRNSRFVDLKFEGVWSAGSAIVDTDCAVILNSLSGAVESSRNTFEGCTFEKFAYAVISNWDIEHTQFSRCTFNRLGYGVLFGNISQVGATGQTVGPSHNTIENSVFENINRQAIWVINGEYNISSQNRFVLVGNSAGIETTPVYPIIQYDKKTNKSVSDYFARTRALTTGANLNTVPYIPEIEGTAQYSLDYENSVQFGRQNNIRLFRLPGVQSQSYELDYTIVSNSYRVIRSGVMTVTVDGVQGNVEVSDDFDFVGDETFLDDINFSAQLRDADSDGTAETINMRVTSTMPNDDQSTIKFTVKAKKTDTP